MDVIKPNHSEYIVNDYLKKFIKENGIRKKAYQVTTEEYLKVINNFAGVSTENENKVKSALHKWIAYDGRKKILYRTCDLTFLRDINLEELNEMFVLEDMRGFDELTLPTHDRELWSIWIERNDGLNTINFGFVEKIKQRLIEQETHRVIPLPIVVTLDITNNEAIVGVPARVNLFRNEEDNTSDVKIAQSILEQVLDTLGCEVILSADEIEKHKEMIYDLHDIITELPQEIIDKADVADDDINNFINNLVTTIPELNTEDAKDELFSCLKNVITKHVITVHSADDELFEMGKFAKSIGLHGSGRSMSNFNFKTPGKESVQSNPEYQDIKNILKDTENIKKNVILWNDEVSDRQFKIKIYMQNQGYILISFEEYIYREDVQNVLSKIREFKE